MLAPKWYLKQANASIALIDVPQMRRRKFSYQGKPHGRNEMISVYLWIAYLQSLPPGAVPDQSMARDRKQVSSHIQVLKNFFKDHPACKNLLRALFDPN
jgi:transcriptional enhancer factor